MLGIGLLLGPGIQRGAWGEPYEAYVETEGDLTLYAYTGDTSVQVFDSGGIVVWSGVLTPGTFNVISVPAGTYRMVGSSIFGAMAGIHDPSQIPGGIPQDAHPSVITPGHHGGVHAITVPFRGNPNLSHDTYNGRQVTLKGAIRGKAGVTYTYEWDFGDGTPKATGTVTNAYVIEAKHTYPNSPTGTTFRARLRVFGSDGDGPATSPFAEDEYPVTVRDNTLDVRVNIAIENGLWYLHKQMGRFTTNWGAGNVDWGQITNEMGYHAQAMEAFQNQGHLATGDPYEDPYVETVQRGLNRVLRNLTSAGIRPQPAGNPDSNGNGIGLYAVDAHMYRHGIVLLALASSQAPNRVAAPVNRANVDGRTYKDIVQDMADFAAWAQNENNPWYGGKGGWRYYPNSGNSDWSAAQWPLLGLQATESNFGTIVPAWVKNELKLFIASGQYYPGDGGFGYEWYGSWRNVAKTGAGLIGLAWTGFPATDGRVTKAKSFIAANWNSDNKGNYYAMYAVMKGARLTNLQIEKFGTVDWYTDYANYLVGAQGGDGGWPGGPWAGRELDTAWAILILSPTVFKPQPVAVLEVVPNPTDKDIAVTFDGTKSFDTNQPPLAITQYKFDFGNGTTYTETAASAPDGAFDGKTTHTYTAYATYTASLKVTNADDPPQVSAPANVAVRIIPPDHPPTAVIGVLSGATRSAEPGIDYETYLGATVTFDGSGSFDIDERYGDAIVSYTWDFTGFPYDYADATGAQASYRWNTEGVKDVSLRVTDIGDPSWTPPGPLSGVAFLKIKVLPNAPPVANAGPDQIVEQANAAGTPVTLDGSRSSDPNNDPLTYRWTWPGGSATGVNPTVTLPLGATTITLVVNDGKVDSEPDQVIIGVRDTTPPMVDAGANATVEQAAAAGTEVTLNGTARDICDASPSYEWSEGGVVLGNGASLTRTFNLGTHILTLKSTDASGNSATDMVVVTVQDTTPPTIQLTGTTLTIWPPNHKYSTVSIPQCVASVKDICDVGIGVPSVVLTSVSSDELEDAQGMGDGNTLNDIVINGGQTVQLQAERQGGDNGRVYTIHFKVTDSSGNSATGSCMVTVPHDQSGVSAVDDGPAYTVNSP